MSVPVLCCASGLGHIFKTPIDRLPKKLWLGKVEGHLVALGLVSGMLHYVTVRTVVEIEPIGMHRTYCSGETRLALNVPSSS